GGRRNGPGDPRYGPDCGAILHVQPLRGRPGSGYPRRSGLLSDARRADRTSRVPPARRGIPPAFSAPNASLSMPHIPIPDDLPGIRGLMAYRLETALPINQDGLT